ncbi:MAG: SAM-dependent methyltransferase, partial [Clostridiaceae bacterium]
MKNNSINKLKLFFLGLENRFNENLDLFENLEVVFKSGNKEFKGIGKLESIDNKTVRYNFNGITIKDKFKFILDSILKEVSKYEEIRFIYNERVSSIKIEGNDKNVSMKNVENKNPIKENKTSTLLNRNYLIKVGEAD